MGTCSGSSRRCDGTNMAFEKEMAGYHGSSLCTMGDGCIHTCRILPGILVRSSRCSGLKRSRRFSPYSLWRVFVVLDILCDSYYKPGVAFNNPCQDCKTQTKTSKGPVAYCDSGGGLICYSRAGYRMVDRSGDIWRRFHRGQDCPVCPDFPSGQLDSMVLHIPVFCAQRRPAMLFSQADEMAAARDNT